MTVHEVVLVVVAVSGMLGGFGAYVVSTVRHYTEKFDGMTGELREIRIALKGDDMGGRGIVGRLSDMEARLAEIDERLSVLEEQGRE